MGRGLGPGGCGSGSGVWVGLGSWLGELGGVSSLWFSLVVGMYVGVRDGMGSGLGGLGTRLGELERVLSGLCGLG